MFPIPIALFPFLLLLTFLFFQFLPHPSPQNQSCYLNIPLPQFSFIDTRSNNSLHLITKYIPARTHGRKQKIPYHIFQTNQKDMIPWKMNYAVHTVLEKNPEFTYRFLNATQRRDFIANHFGDEILMCYNKLNANAFKADLFRFLLVYTYGGCYIDNPFIAIDSLISSFNPSIRFFSTLDGASSDYFLNAAFFCSVPGHQILKLTIEKILKSISRQKYDIDTLDVTGPRKLGAGFVQYNNMSKITGAGYFDGGKILIVEREFGWRCNFYLMRKLNKKKDIVMLNRYPDYDRDMKEYTSLPHYHVYYDMRMVYDKELKVEIGEEYQIKGAEEYRSIGDDYLVPKEFRVVR